MKNKDLKYDYRFIKNNMNLVFMMMGYCMVLVWKGFEFSESELEIQSLQIGLFKYSVLMAICGLFLFALLNMTFMFRINLNLKKKMIKYFYLYGTIAVVSSTWLLVRSTILRLNISIEKVFESVKYDLLVMLIIGIALPIFGYIMRLLNKK